MPESDAFDDYALEYDQWFERHAVEYALELDAIREFLLSEGRGIEIGAGTGRFAQPLGISLGVEPSAAMRSLGVRRGVKMIAGTAESLPVADGVYDFALMVTADCFFEVPELAFKEVNRILKNKGYVIVGMIDKDSSLGKKYDRNKHASKFYRCAEFHSVVELEAILVKAGFSHIECVQTLLPGDTEGGYAPVIRHGYGEGSFVVMRAQKVAV